MAETLTEIRRRAANALRNYLTASETERTAALRAAAEALVDARERFYKSDGEIDWRGQSYAYRRWVGDVYTLANLPKEEVPTVQAAVRYHVGNVLRERLSPEELDEIGLRSVGPRERAVEKRQRQSETLSLLAGGPLEPEDTVQALAAVDRLLARVNAASLKKLSAEDRRAARKALQEAAEAVETLSKAAGSRRG